MDNSNLIWFLVPGFLLFFAGMWIVIARLLSWFGWSKFVSDYAWDRPVPDQARRFSWASMVIGRFPGGISYRTAMNVWIDARGIYLRPVVFMRLFHPMLHIGWDAIASAEPRKTLWVKACQLSFRRDLPMMTFGGNVGQAIFEHWQSRQNRPV